MGRPEIFPVPIGSVFGSLTVVSEDSLRIRGRKTFICRCECGTEKSITGNALKSGNTISCGCKSSQNFVYRLKLSHGLANKLPEYSIWKGIKKRCYNSNDKEYYNYGGRGITVCDEWREDFAQFLKDVGSRPEPNLTIERIDNNRGYEIGNVRWATRSEQVRNTRRTVINLDVARQIKSMRSLGPTAISRTLGISKQIATHVLAGRSWAEA